MSTHDPRREAEARLILDKWPNVGPMADRILAWHAAETHALRETTTHLTEQNRALRGALEYVKRAHGHVAGCYCAGHLTIDPRCLALTPGPLTLDDVWPQGQPSPGEE